MNDVGGSCSTMDLRYGIAGGLQETHPSDIKNKKNNHAFLQGVVKMKNRNKKQVIGFVAAIVLAAVMYPLYAADKDGGKCSITASSDQGCSKQVAAQNDDGYFRGSDEQWIWDPFSEFVRMRQEMNSLLNGTFSPYQGNPSWDNSWANTVTDPACDIKDRDGSYLITIDLPGMKKSDIKIKIGGNILTISGQRSGSFEKKDGEKMILQERTQGSFSRSIRLLRKIKQDEVAATYINGILTITLPQKEQVDNSIEVPVK